LQFNGVDEYLENTVRQALGVANLWTISLWMKPFQTDSVFDVEGRQLFRPDGKALLHLKGLAHKNEILIWGDRVEDSVHEEFIVVENWDDRHNRLRITRFNLVQKRQEWRQFSCAWDGTSLVAWDNGQEVTDYSGTFSGAGSYTMLDPSSSEEGRSVRIAAAYSGIANSLDGPRIVAYSGLLGPVGVWDDLLTGAELRAINSGTFGTDLSTNSGTYTSSANLAHWWRLGADAADIGADYVGTGQIDVAVSATVDAGNIVVDSP
jgi:hypothetical protein